MSTEYTLKQKISFQTTYAQIQNKKKYEEIHKLI